MLSQVIDLAMASAALQVVVPAALLAHPPQRL
jgi:hypothetical protein